jgi:5-hydroxyisourate hydrolase
MSGISCHVLDTSLGRPAAGVRVRLERELDGARGWVTLAEAATNADGRAQGLLGAEPLGVGLYRLTFETNAYFAARGQPAFYPEVPVLFVVSSAEEHYHIPLLLSPFGYSTYRGS